MWRTVENLTKDLSLCAAALLAGWWLFARTVYFPPQGTVAVALLVGAMALLTITNLLPRSRNGRAVLSQHLGASKSQRTKPGFLLSGTLFLLATVITPWPERVIPLFFAAGSLLAAWMATEKTILSALGQACLAVGLILSTQWLVLQAYFFQTMRWRDIPEAWVPVLAFVLRLFGIDAASAGSSLALAHSAQVALVPVTWELALDPATTLAWVGGLVALVWRELSWSGLSPRKPAGREFQEKEHAWERFQSLAILWTLALLIFIPIRLALILGLHLHRILLTPVQIPVIAGDVFISPTVAIAFIFLLVIIAALLTAQMPGGASLDLKPKLLSASQSFSQGEEGSGVAGNQRKGSMETAPTEGGGEEAWRRLMQGAVALMAILGVGVCVVALLWDPPGSATLGRVMVVERHSTWEPTDRPYDTEHFGHDPSYSYTLAYNYLEQYFTMSRLHQEDEITRERLKSCDVLIVKIPTERWQRGEIAAVVDFVRQGGGLLLVGDHTNVFNSSTYLNDICRQFGFAYAADLLFWMPDAYRQPWRPGFASHPSVARVPPLHFAVGCSIDPGRSRGRAAIWSAGLWSLPCDFHTPNYHPVPQWRSDMRYGAFIQSWAMRFGRGRVIAFTDSTIFSNFCIFQPGKVELLREMVWWLACRGVYDWPTARWLIPVAATILGLGLLATAAVVSFAFNLSALVLIAALVFGFSFGFFVVDQLHVLGNPSPLNKAPHKWVVIDRTTSQVPLALGAFNVDESGNGFGLLEQWVSRLGYYTARREGIHALGEAGLLVICPTKSPPKVFLEKLVSYVRTGGRLLVLDSPTSPGTTANSLLWNFGLEVLHVTARGGKIRFIDGGPQLEVDLACEVRGGETFAWIDDLPVAARRRFGQGTVMAIGFATLWNDRNMGEHWMVASEPTLFRREDLAPELRDRFDALFAILRAWLEDVPIERPKTPSAKNQTTSSSDNRPEDK